MSKILIGRSDTDLDYPICRPSLDLDFTQEVLDPRITFARGSIGTRVNRNRLIETVSANVPRFDYAPISGECRGLLIEESRTNLLTYSGDVSNAAWGKGNASLGSTIISPDGTSTAYKITENTTNNFHNLAQGVGTISGTYTVSCFVKAGERYRGYIQVFSGGGNASAFFNLKTGTITTSVGTTTITPYPNGWYRVTASSTFTSASAAVYFVINRDDGTAIYSGDNNSGIYVWGLQLEAGAFPTSYIPTTASTPPRSADLASITGTNFSSWYNQSEGTFFTQAKSIATISGATRRFLEVSGGSAANRYLLGYSALAITRFLVTSSSINVANTLISSIASPSAGVKMCASYSTDNFSQATNGVLSTKDLQGAVPTVDRMIIGWDNITSNAILCGTISRLTYYPRALKPNQLQLLTQ